MPVFDTPITTDDNSLDRVLGQDLPVMLVLYNQLDSSLDAALKRTAKDYAGEILVTKVDVNSSPGTLKRFENPPLPALLTLDEGRVESRAGGITAGDIDAHADFLMGQGPLPKETVAQTQAKADSGAAPVPVTDSSFPRDVLESDIPVLVDFWAPWCGPCHMVAPVLDRIAAQYAGKVKIAKLNVDENPYTARQFQAMSIPMLLMFKGGQPVGKLVGAHPQPNIENLIKQAL